MPLVKSTKDTARARNLATEIKAGRDPLQAAAIAYSVQERAKSHQRNAAHGRARAKGGKR